jgi:hypothetical protein
MIARDENGVFMRYTWPGGYPVYHICSDGEPLCSDCAIACGHTDMPDDSWRIVGSDINWEDPDLRCAHCNGNIESAYWEEGR